MLQWFPRINRYLLPFEILLIILFFPFLLLESWKGKDNYQDLWKNNAAVSFSFTSSTGLFNDSLFLDSSSLFLSVSALLSIEISLFCL